MADYGKLVGRADALVSFAGNLVCKVFAGKSFAITPDSSCVPAFLPRPEFRRHDLVTREVAFVQTQQFAFRGLAEFFAIWLLDVLAHPLCDVGHGLLLVHAFAHDAADYVAQLRTILHAKGIGLTQ